MVGLIAHIDGAYTLRKGGENGGELGTRMGVRISRGRSSLVILSTYPQRLPLGAEREEGLPAQWEQERRATIQAYRLEGLAGRSD